MRIEKCFIIFTCMLGMATSLSNNECKTPNDRNGYCINIKDCPKLLKLILIHRNQSSVLAKLKRYQCGSKGNITKVCCPLNVNSSPTFLRKPDIIKQVSVEHRCGTTNITRRKIIGGTKAELGAWPWMAALGYYGQNRDVRWLCGGTLISRSHVLTAAHCLTEVSYKLTTVRLGELDLDPTVEDGAIPIDFEVDRIIIHAEYNRETFTSDIALVKLKESVDFNEFIQPICLPATKTMKNADMSRIMAFHAGWGTFNPNPSFKYTLSLMEVQVPIHNISFCQKAYSNEGTVIDDRVLCAGYSVATKGLCWGNSGSPLMFQKGKQYFLMGIVSYGPNECGRPGYPDVYTRVSSFIDWIYEKLNEN